MVGFPYDDLTSWRSIFPADIYISQNSRVADGFEHGADILKQAIAREKDSAVRKMLKTDLRRAEGFKCIFKSIVNQSKYVLCRDKGDSDGMRTAVENEIANVREFIPLCDEDPTFGFESSNHYFFVRQDLVEKLINLESLL